ncbi:MAG: thiamine ABC transporter substrate binding subunit [Hyphomicrobiales bacterium]
MKKLLFTLIALVFAASPGFAAPKLTIYTYESFVSEWGPGPKIKAAFESTCGCEIEWVGIADGVALLNRLKLEGKGTKADIVLGLDTNLTAEAAATGLFAPHEQIGTPLTLPISWSDPIFLPYDYGYFAVVYDTQALKDAPKSLADLVAGDPKQKIVIEDPRSSTPGLGLLLWIKAVYGDKAAEAWTKLKPRILTVTPGWSEAYGLFTKGEAPMVLSYTTSPAYHMVAENTDRYQAAAFSEGHYLQVEVAGRIADSPNAELAKKFMAFMLTPGFQDAIPENNWMFPAAATSKPLPEAFSKLVQPVKTLLFSPEDVAAKRREWMDEWLAAMAR